MCSMVLGDCERVVLPPEGVTTHRLRTFDLGHCHWQTFLQDWRGDTALILHIGILVMKSGHMDFLCSEFVMDRAGCRCRGREGVGRVGSRGWKWFGWMKSDRQRRLGWCIGCASCPKPGVWGKICLSEKAGYDWRVLCFGRWVGTILGQAWSSSAVKARQGCVLLAGARLNLVGNNKGMDGEVRVLTRLDPGEGQRYAWGGQGYSLG